MSWTIQDGINDSESFTHAIARAVAGNFMKRHDVLVLDNASIQRFQENLDLDDWLWNVASPNRRAASANLFDVSTYAIPGTESYRTSLASVGATTEDDRACRLLILGCIPFPNPWLKDCYCPWLFIP
jgi:hypothetical protein